MLLHILISQVCLDLSVADYFLLFQTQKLFSPDMFRMDNALPNANQNANNLQNANIAKSQFNNVPNDLLPHHLQPIQVITFYRALY